MSNKIIQLYDNPILRNFSEEMIEGIKSLLDADMNNNQKSKLIGEKLVYDYEFTKLGTGTNRVAFFKDGLVYKIPLDQYGVIDNRVEYLVSLYENLKDEVDESNIAKYITKTFMLESDGLVIASEYVEVLADIEEFENYKKDILKTAKKISNDYIFDDIGYNSRNYKNFGVDEDGQLKILDYGYLKPHDTIDLNCPTCTIGTLNWNNNYTMLICNNDACEDKIRPFSIFKRTEDIDNKFTFDDDEIDDFEFLDYEELSNMSIMELFENGVPFHKVFDLYVTNFKF